VLTAQKNYLDSIPPKDPVAILQIGSNFAINSNAPNAFRSGAFSFEFAHDRSNFFGIQYARLYAKSDNITNGIYDFYDSPIADSSYAKYGKGNEFGLYFKTFAHPRFSHRRSNYYVGFGFRTGARNVSIYLKENNPVTGRVISTETINLQHHHQKYLILLGYQFNFKHFVFEIGAPAGFEKITPDQNDKIYRQSIMQFVILVVLQVGYKL
jgi:hypothetical protein